jgi:sulfur carrier protein ThiS
MKIKVKIHYSIQNNLPKRIGETVEIPEGGRVEDFIKFIGIDDPNSVMVSNSEGILSVDAILKDGDEIKILPVVTGG